MPAEQPAVTGVLEEEREPRKPIWDRSGNSGIWAAPQQPAKAQKPQRKRGPKPDLDNHLRVAALLRRYGDDWILDDNLLDICEKLDELRIPVPKTWPSRKDARSHTWTRGFHNYPNLVIKAIKDRLKAAEAHAAKPPKTSAEPPPGL